MRVSGRHRPALDLVKNCLVKESRTLDCLRRALMLKALDDAARLVVPLLRIESLICSDEVTRCSLRSSSRLRPGASEAAPEQIGHFDEERPAIAPETGF